jgi:HipA-like protein
MRKVAVYRNNHLTGHLIQMDDRSYEFIYIDEYFSTNLPAVSLTLPKSQKKYQSKTLFAAFYNLLSEGANLNLQLKLLKIDKKDYLSLLINTASYDTIGPLSFKEIQ